METFIDISLGNITALFVNIKLCTVLGNSGSPIFKIVSGVVLNWNNYLVGFIDKTIFVVFLNFRQAFQRSYQQNCIELEWLSCLLY